MLSVSLITGRSSASGGVPSPGIDGFYFHLHPCLFLSWISGVDLFQKEGISGGHDKDTMLRLGSHVEKHIRSMMSCNDIYYTPLARDFFT